MIALLPAYLTKAYVRGHLRTLADGRAIQVHPYHTKTAAASREDAKTRDIFADIPPAENQHRPRIHPARTTTPRKAVVPFQAVYPQLFDDNPLASDQNGHYNKDIKGRNPAPATEEKKMDSKPNDAHHDPIHGYTDSVAQLEKDREQERRLRSELADAKRAEDEEWTPEVTEKRRAEWNDWLKAANGRKLSAKEIAEQEKKQGFTLDALKRHLARHGVDKRHVATKAALLKEMGKDLDAAKGTPIATDIKTVIDLIVSTDPENRPFQDTVKDKWSKGEKAAFERFKAWKAEKNATAAKEREAKATPEQAKPATSTPGRIYLSVPYDQKDKAKATADKAGTRIRFDGDKKKWYWEGEGDLPGALARWAPEGAKPQGSGEPAMDDERKKLVALFDGDHAKADAEQQVHIEIIKAAVMRTQPKAGKDLWETAKKEFGPREKNAYAHYMEFKRLQASAGQTPIHASDREIYANAHGQWAAEKKYGRRE